MSGVTNGKFLNAKYFLLSMEVHSLTDSRYVVDILNKLGHFMPYKLTREIETSQAETAENVVDDEGTILLIVPSDESSSALVSP